MGFWSGNENQNDKNTSALDKPSVVSGADTPATVSVGSTSTTAMKNKAGLDKFGKVRSALSEGTVIQGKLSFDTPVRIDGKLSGEVYSTSALIVGEGGEIDADVQAESLIILGQVKGTVQVSGRVELLEGGRLEGDVKTPVLVIQENTVFEGNCTMGKSPERVQVKSTDIKKKAEDQKPEEKQEASATKEPEKDKKAPAGQHEARVH